MPCYKTTVLVVIRRVDTYVDMVGSQGRLTFVRSVSMLPKNACKLVRRKANRPAHT